MIELRWINRESSYGQPATLMVPVPHSLASYHDDSTYSPYVTRWFVLQYREFEQINEDTVRSTEWRDVPIEQQADAS